MCHGDEGRFARCSFKRSIACRESIASVETALHHGSCELGGSGADR